MTNLLNFKVLAADKEQYTRFITIYTRNLSMKNKGSLEVICGSMFSGKSEELIRRLRRAQFAQLTVIAFKHQFDNRYTSEHIRVHNGNTFAACATASPEEILQLTHTDVQVVGIDEIQFYPSSIVPVIYTLIAQSKRIIVSGLDLDFKAEPFGCMPKLMAIADRVTKLKAICIQCGTDAHFTQRLVNHQPAQRHDPLIVIGAQEQYQARCRSCYQIDQMPTQ